VNDYDRVEESTEREHMVRSLEVLERAREERESYEQQIVLTVTRSQLGSQDVEHLDRERAKCAVGLVQIAERRVAGDLKCVPEPNSVIAVIDLREFEREGLVVLLPTATLCVVICA
jgi:hypothetical protein